MIVYSCYNRIFTNTTAKSAFKSLCRFRNDIPNNEFIIFLSIVDQDRRAKRQLGGVFKIYNLMVFVGGLFLRYSRFHTQIVSSNSQACSIYLHVVLETISLLFQYKLGNTEIDRHFLSVFFGPFKCMGH